MTSLCPLRLKSFIIDFYLDYINPTSPRTQFIKYFVFSLNFILLFNSIICYISNDKQVSLVLYDISYFLGGIRIYNKIFIMSGILHASFLVKFFYVTNDNVRVYWMEMLEIYRRPTKIRLLIPYQHFVRYSPDIFKQVKIFNNSMLLLFVILGKFEW